MKEIKIKLNDGTPYFYYDNKKSATIKGNVMNIKQIKGEYIYYRLDMVYKNKSFYINSSSTNVFKTIMNCLINMEGNEGVEIKLYKNRNNYNSVDVIQNGRKLKWYLSGNEFKAIKKDKLDDFLYNNLNSKLSNEPLFN